MILKTRSYGYLTYYKTYLYTYRVRCSDLIKRDNEHVERNANMIETALVYKNSSAQALDIASDLVTNKERDAHMDTHIIIVVR